MVAISGESAHGFDFDVRSCSSVGSMNLGIISQITICLSWNNCTYFMNFKAALKPQGSFNGLSKTLPNMISSAEYG